MSRRRWDPCVEHRGDDAVQFLRRFFADASRRVCLVAGAGFDPRTTALPKILADVMGARLRALFLREERPAPSKRLVATAERHLAVLRELVPNSTTISIEVLSTDNAVVGGRNAVQAIASQSFDDVTDIVVDMSALSIGTSFPVVRLLLDKVKTQGSQRNVHVVVLSMPPEDESRARVSNDSASLVHSFHGTLRLHSESGSAKLWMPQLSIPKREALERIFATQTSGHTRGFDDVCPILPFPAADPRAADLIAEHFAEQLETAWDVDARNLVYAAEDDPLDVYRTILAIEEQRRPVFEKVGSTVVLSPVGTKAVALGSLMAAIERDLPVLYVEAVGYRPPPKEQAAAKQQGKVLHVWLHGEAYPQLKEEDSR